MSAAFADCFLCPARISTSDWMLSDEQVAELFRAKGWTIGPTRCPDHVGIEEAPPRDSCIKLHDPEPMLSSGMMTGGRMIRTSDKRFAPRPEYCQWAHHYGN